MKAPWLAELKPGDVFYCISHELVLSMMTVVDVSGCDVMAKDREHTKVRWCTDTNYSYAKPIRATPAAHAAYEALKRLWDEIDGARDGDG